MISQGSATGNFLMLVSTYVHFEAVYPSHFLINSKWIRQLWKIYGK